MSGTHRARSRRKNAGKAGKALPAAITAAVAVAAIGATVLLVRSGDGTAPSGNVPTAARTPRTGTPLELTDTEGFSYSLGAVKADLDSDRRAYIDYLVTNTSGRTAPFESPGQLFLPEQEAGTEACAPQEGTEAGMCSPPTDTEIISALGGVQPSSDGVDRYMPKDASFVVRVITRQPVTEDATAADLRLYVWDVRFVANQIAQAVPLP